MSAQSPSKTKKKIQMTLTNCFASSSSVSQQPHFLSQNEDIKTNINICFCTDEQQFVPPLLHVFPKDKHNRSCQVEWFREYCWLHYQRSNDTVVCWYCLEAVRAKGIPVPKETAFLVGAKSWSHMKSKLKEHSSAVHHQKSVAYKSNKISVVSLIDKQAKTQQDLAYSALDVIFSAVRYCGKQCIGFQGHEHNTGNFMSLVKELSRQKSKETYNWLTNRRDNFCSDTIQNEIIQIFAHKIQSGIATEIDESNFIGLICDGTTDVSGNEQESICIRYCKDYETIEAFIGFYNPPDTTAASITKSILDVCCRLNIQLSHKLASFAFDGAANMSGIYNGTQRKLTDMFPESFYIHCSNHSLDLCLQEVSRSVDIISSSMGFVHAIATLVKDSPKRKNQWESICGDTSSLVTICPTRWCIRCDALQRCNENYLNVINFLKEIECDINLRHTSKATIKGLRKQSQKLKTLLGIRLSISIFSLCEPFAKALQRPSCSANTVKKSIAILQQSLKDLRKSEKFDKMFQSSLCFDSCVLPPDNIREKTTPKRFRHSDTPEDLVMHYKLDWRRQYYEALDLIDGELSRRFNQQGLDRAVAREEILLNAASIFDSTVFDEAKLPPTIDRATLASQLTIFQALWSGLEKAPTSITEVATKIKQTDKNVLSCIPEVLLYAKICYCDMN